jgi:dTDP-4-dehydrorhamnose 3,5-epimerase and related enzymes
MEPISIGGAWTFTPALHRDDRGCFLEWFRAAELSESLGYRPEVAQANCSVSRRGVVRGHPLRQRSPRAGKVRHVRQRRRP